MVEAQKAVDMAKQEAHNIIYVYYMYINIIIVVSTKLLRCVKQHSKHLVTRQMLCMGTYLDLQCPWFGVYFSSILTQLSNATYVLVRVKQCVNMKAAKTTGDTAVTRMHNNYVSFCDSKIEACKKKRTGEY